MSVVAYFSTYLALLFLLALTVALSFVNLGTYQESVAIFIAACKALLIVLFFMHVIKKRFLWTLIAGAFIFALSVSLLLLTDYLMR